MIYNKLYEEIITLVSKELNIPREVVFVAHLSQWLFIKKHIEALPLKETYSEEEFDKLRVNFNLPSLGKLYTTWERVINQRKRLTYIKNYGHKTNKDKATI